MPYTPQTWADDDLTKPLSAARMNYIEAGIAAAGGTDPDALAAGETTMPRKSVITGGAGGINPSLTSGRLVLGAFTAQRTETINNLCMWVTTTAASATPTLVRLAVYTVNADGTLTLTASTANDTSVFAAAQTRYQRALTTPFSKVAGQRYAAGALVVTGGTAPAVAGSVVSSTFFTQLAPVLAYRVDSQTDLPASVSLAVQNGAASLPYVELLP